MKNTYKDAGYTYTINRLQETARTFRNLGDAYGETNQKQTGFKRQLRTDIWKTRFWRSVFLLRK